MGKGIVGKEVSEEEGKISPSGYQVEHGKLDLSAINKSFVIMAEFIPSWLVMLAGKTELRNLFVFVENEDISLRRSLGLIDKFAITPFTDEFIQWPWGASHQPEDLVVLVQGTSKFVGKCLHAIGPRVTSMGCSVIAVSTGARLRGSQSVPSLRWQKICHDQVGGVTNGIYQIGATAGYHRPAPLSSCKRFIKDIMKVDVGGHEVTAPKDQQFRVHPRELLNFVTAPSVFSRITGWVKRKLSRREVAAAMDIPVSVIPDIEDSVDDDCLRKVTSVPPVKVIQSAFGLITSKLSAEGLSKQSKPREDNQSVGGIALAGGGVSDIQAAEISKSNAKAVKSDDAATDEDFWNWGAVTPPASSDSEPSAWNLVTGVYDPATHGPIFTFLRERMTRQFSRNVTASARNYLHQTYTTEELKSGDSANGELKEDLSGIKDALKRVRGASFWDWDAGSFPFFWRWQPEVKKDMRDGTKLFVKGQLPATTQGQSLPRDKTIAEKIVAKVNKVRYRGYIAMGRVLSLTSYFHVPKGESDIRIVYDLTKSGLNDALWAPTFWMPTVMNVLDCATHSSWFGDVDAGEMFLNYPLDKGMRPYAGVDVSWSRKEEFDTGPRESRWERWTRMAMGMLPSPWVTTRLFSWAMEIIKGDRTEPLNPFHWTRVILNCPGDTSYDPSMPRVYKWNDRLNAIAGDCKTFVDDLRSVGATKEMCHAVTHRVETMMGYLGLQDATRKRRPDSQAPGEWTGTITRAIEGIGLFVTVSQAKWDRARKILSDIYSHFDDKDELPELDLKDLEKKVGFLVHLAMAYPLMFPFLKGFYLTMNSWRPMRDDNGWKMSKRAYDAFVEASGKKVDPSSHDHFDEHSGDAPTRVTACALMRDHISTLMELFSSATPSLRLIRGSLIHQVLYIFGDASGAGFGASWNDGEQKDVNYRFGVWAEEGQDTSSNYRECRNLVETLEDMGCRGDLEGREIFLFTDNMVSESIASKGSSKQSTLYDLIVRLYKLEMVFCCKITFVHVAGTRMIKQGTDGLSRGDLVEGVMRGESMLSFIPLHLSCIDRSPILKSQLEECLKGFGNKVELLEPEGWFERGHDFLGGRKNCDGVWMPKYCAGTFIWAPPPGAARYAIEELRQARQKRQKSFHVFVCPRLLYDEWRRHLYKSADMIVFLPAGKCDSWSSDMHETLVLAFFFPYLPRDPWEFRKSRLMVGLEKQNFAFSREGCRPCRFSTCSDCYRDDPNSPFPINRAFGDESVYYRRRREDECKYKVARKGDWTICPFQCDGCWFMNLFSREPVVDSVADAWNLSLIRRANLDLFWSRDASTVSGIRGNTKELIRRARAFGRKIPLSPMSPWPVDDLEGMGVVLAMLEKSVEKGRNSDKYMQFDTVRKLRSAAANVYSATSQAASLRYCLKSGNRLLHLEEGPTQRNLIERIVIGMENRMPKESSRNLPLTSRMILYILDNLEEELYHPATNVERARLITMTGAYLVITFGYSLRGNEGFWVDCERLCKYIQVGKYDGRQPHVLIPLLGRFKSEGGDRMHVIPLVNFTRSGIPIRTWVERLVTVLKGEGKSDCPAFCDEEGYQLYASTLELVIHPILKKMQKDPLHRDVIPRSLDVTLWYLLARSCRRGAENEALDRNLDADTINLVHRWSQYEKSRGKQPKGFDMMQHYASGENTRYRQLKFSAIL